MSGVRGLRHDQIAVKRARGLAGDFMHRFAQRQHGLGAPFGQEGVVIGQERLIVLGKEHALERLPLRLPPVGRRNDQRVGRKARLLPRLFDGLERAVLLNAPGEEIAAVADAVIAAPVFAARAPGAPVGRLTAAAERDVIGENLPRVGAVFEMLYESPQRFARILHPDF